jgi:hypothetical protein
VSGDREARLDWLRERVQTIGRHNSEVLATRSDRAIANICAVSQSIESTFQNFDVKSNCVRQRYGRESLTGHRPQGALDFERRSLSTT